MQYAPAPPPQEEKSHGCLYGWSVLPRPFLPYSNRDTPKTAPRAGKPTE